MKSGAWTNDASDFPPPPCIALFRGDITPAVIMLLTGTKLAQAKLAIAAWVRSGAAQRSRGARTRISPAFRASFESEATPRVRRQAHETIARALDEPDADEATLLTVARAYRDAQLCRPAVARFLTLAERLLDRDEYVAAATILAEAAQISARGPEMFAVLERHAHCAVTAGDYAGALKSLERFRRLTAECGDRFAAIRALLLCADCHARAGIPEHAIAFASRALELTAGIESPVTESTAALAIATALIDRGELEFAEAHVRAAATRGAEHDASLAHRYHVTFAKLKAAAGDGLAAGLAFRSAAAAADVALDTAGGLEATRGLATAYRESVDLPAATSALRAALALARTKHLDALAVHLSLDLSALRLEAGRVADAQRSAPADAPPSCAPILLRIALATGDDASIERWSSPDAVEDALGSRLPYRIAQTVPAFAAYERRCGAADAAYALYRRAIDLIGENRVPIEFWCDAAEYGSPTEWDRIRRAVAAAVRVGRPSALTLLIAEFTEIVLAVRAGDELGGLRARADAVAEAFLLGGFRARAHRAHAIAAQAAPGGRDDRILGLIARGRSNAEIAATLFISKRTVEKSVSDLLKSQGVRSRWQLIAAPRSRAATGPRHAG